MVLILDETNSAVYLLTFDDLYSNMVEYSKFKVRLNNAFRSVQRCFFQGEDQVVCVGVEGYFQIKFVV